MDQWLPDRIGWQLRVSRGELMGLGLVRQWRLLGLHGVATRMLGALAVPSGGSVRPILFGLLLSACTPAVAPVVDAGDGGRSPCATDSLITSNRLIRDPDGTSLVLPPCGDP